MELSILINKFNIKGRLVSLQPFGNGNINDTFLAIYRNTFTETQVILQRVNKNVFPKPEVIMENMHNLTRHCHEKLEDDAQKGRDDRVWQMPRIIKAKDSKDFVVDDKGEVWRVITRIMSAHAFDVAQGPEHAMECGAALGHFHYLISDMDPKEIKDPLPGFHITSGYLKKYDQTLKSKEAKELLKSSMEAKRLAKFIEERRDLALCLEKAQKKGELKKRMFHGDPKVNNIMIDDVTGKGTAMIDLDTVSPGLIHLDFGDALRSICNPAGEEETNLAKVVWLVPHRRRPRVPVRLDTASSLRARAPLLPGLSRRQRLLQDDAAGAEPQPRARAVPPLRVRRGPRALDPLRPQEAVTYDLVEIFESLQGEGRNMGRPCVFVRFAGCNLSCPWCDTDVAKRFSLSLGDLVAEIGQYRPTSVVLTGGEPTLVKEMPELVAALRERGYWIAVETNGTDDADWLGFVDYVACSPKAEFPDRLALPRADEVRVVASSEKIVDFCRDLRGRIAATDYYISPCERGGEMDFATAKAVLAQLDGWSLSVQLHKLLGFR